MNCSQIEELLSRYVEGDVSGGERAAVDTHAAGCAACAESLAMYQELESSLVARRDSRPSPEATVRAVLGRVSVVAKRPWWVSILRPIPTPALLSVALIAVGVVLFAARDSVAQWVTGVLPTEGSADRVAHSLEALVEGVVSFAGANQIVVMTLYFGVFGLIFFTGSVMVLRFVRD